jgi:hypothetical protein
LCDLNVTGERTGKPILVWFICVLVGDFLLLAHGHDRAGIGWLQSDAQDGRAA